VCSARCSCLVACACALAVPCTVWWHRDARTQHTHSTCSTARCDPHLVPERDDHDGLRRLRIRGCECALPVGKLLRAEAARVLLRPPCLLQLPPRHAPPVHHARARARARELARLVALAEADEARVAVGVGRCWCCCPARRLLLLPVLVLIGWCVVRVLPLVVRLVRGRGGQCWEALVVVLGPAELLLLPLVFQVLLVLLRVLRLPLLLVLLVLLVLLCLLLRVLLQVLRILRLVL
jgi:hypothetical protein